MTVPVLYFAFGSNLHLPQMRERCPDCEMLEPVVLADYRLAFRGNSARWGTGGVATVLPRAGAQVHGLLYRLSATDLERLNGYEHYPTVYAHLPVSVTTRAGAQHAALTYQRANGHGEELRPPSMRYFHQIWRNYKAYALDEALLMEAVAETLQSPSSAPQA